MSLRSLIQEFRSQEKTIRKGGDPARQQRLGRLTARERLTLLLDDPNTFLELGLWQGYGMYSEWGGLPAAGLITGIGTIEGRRCMVIANDATVKAGAMFPQSIKKFLRAQRIAYSCKLPTVYLVDSSGVFLPLQDEIFPDEDDFGRIFRNNAVMSAAGIPQYAAIMGNCIAGGGYLPVLCDQLLMTEGSGLYLAGPALVKAAIGQEVETEELGGAKMHAEISGTVDFKEPDDPACLKRLRHLISLLPENPIDDRLPPAEFPSEKIYEILNSKQYEAKELIACLVDQGTIDEYKADYGKTLVTTFAKIGGKPCGIIANQRHLSKTGRGETEMGGVIYAESADKAARFVMDCNQAQIPIIFTQDVAGFMVGKGAEQSGIIRSGAKLVSAVSNSVVPKITLVVGNSFGAGNYALCGKAYDPNFIFAWPNAKFAVMGADQAAETLFQIQKKKENWSDEEAQAHKRAISDKYKESADIRYGAARGWLDGIIYPEETRAILSEVLKVVKPRAHAFHTGVIQV